MMPAHPLTSLVTVQTQLFLQFAIVLFDPPASFANDPDLCLAEQIYNLACQTSLHFLDRPRALPHELSQGLHVGPFDAAGHGFDRLALSVQQQALNINPGPMASLAATQGLQRVFEKTHQATLQGFQAMRCHARL